METISIKAGEQVYPVHVGFGVIGKLQSFLQSQFPKLTSVLIITDETVGALYLKDLIQELGLDTVHTKIVPAGEKAKTFDVYYDCLSYALEKRLDRKSIILSFGGGAVGDLAGFVAASFMRGIPFIQIPTTILAHDSAVGGKVAINHPLGKNMIGAFYQPVAVFYDLHFLTSLPPAELRSGFAEVIKHALISDSSFYNWLVENITRLEDIPAPSMVEFLTKGIQVKAGVVEVDEKESGIRAHLNFGHTLGHAIEAEMGYGAITHGEAVTIGMVFALQLSERFHKFDFNRREFIQWVKHLGYQTNLPKGLSVSKLLERMKQDKKSFGQTIHYVLLSEVGQPYVRELGDDFLLENLGIFIKTGGL
ncbi:3-dehydroquinate synthase [Mesobacillus persicus]|uniref:3-dehydroquinate synthase n=1 Tax=Mesobacillus persicus TaxID=930146 RepID=A0A1H8BSR8_9BACI|nr:3-dehydroquinate synthase [Mesobacillus persicus]SEM84927.1 3-dehydroquinate synthase [Mesobacillus persicus]